MSRRPPNRGQRVFGMTGRQWVIVILLLTLLLLGGGGLLGYALGVFNHLLTPASPSPPIEQIPPTTPQETANPVPTTAEPVIQLTRVTSTVAVSESPTVTIGSQTPLARGSPTITNTATITTTPAPNVCSQLNLQFLGAVSNVAQWRLQNASGTALELTRAEVYWPQSNDAVFNVFLNGTAIWSSQDFVPPTIIGSWIGTPSDRMVDGVERLEFFFGLSAEESGYNLTLWFGNGCRVSAAN